MRTLPVNLDSYEMRVLRGKAARQIRTPENLARYYICRGLGIATDESDQWPDTVDVPTTITFGRQDKQSVEQATVELPQ